MSLTISRSGISSTEITLYSPAERFIKLPVEAYLKLLPAYDIDGSLSNAFELLNAPQFAFINAINGPAHRFIVAALSRRLGKTYIANVVGQLVTLVPGYDVLIVAPNYSLSSISFNLQKQLIKTFDLEVEKMNDKERIITLSNGSSVRMTSTNTVDNAVGRSYNLILFDEAALSDGEEAFNVSLRPTLDRPNSKAIFISTPRGKLNWFSKFFDRGFSAEFPEWISIHADYHENRRMSEKDVAEARRSMSKAFFEQEYMASFNSFEGRIYNFLDTNIREYTWMEGDEVIAGLDPGYKDETALVVVVYRESDNTYWVVEDYLESGLTTSQHVKNWEPIIGRHGLETIFIDSAAAQTAADLAYTYDIATIKAKKDVLPGIASLQTIVEQERLNVSPECRNMLDMLAQYRWDDRSTLLTEKPVHDKFSHMADALRYAVYSFTVGS